MRTSLMTKYNDEDPVLILRGGNDYAAPSEDVYVEVYPKNLREAKVGDCFEALDRSGRLHGSFNTRAVIVFIGLGGVAVHIRRWGGTEIPEPYVWEGDELIWVDLKGGKK